MTVKKIIKMSEELNDSIREEMDARPSLYRNAQNQLSEAELIRRAVVFYLNSLSDSSIGQNPAA